MKIKGSKKILLLLTTVTLLLIIGWGGYYTFSVMMYGLYNGPSSKLMKTFASMKQQGVAGTKSKVLILYSNSTANFFGNQSNYQSLISMWTEFFNNRNISYAVVGENNFSRANLNSYDIMVLPLTVCLSSKEIELIRSFVSEGKKGLILTGFTGARDENGTWREFSFLSEIIGGVNLKVLPMESDKGSTPFVNLVINGTSMLAARIPPGFRLGINTYNQPIAADIVEPRVNTDACWENNGFNLFKTSQQSGLVHGTYLSGRFVWMGFPVGSVRGEPSNKIVWQQLLNNIYNYVSFQSIFCRDRWPGGKRAAVVFAEDTGEKFENAVNAVNIFSEAQVPCTFFCVPGIAVQYIDVFKKISSMEKFEIGLYSIQMYNGQSIDIQKKRLKSGKEDMETISQKQIFGFRPPEALYDQNTLNALLDLEYDYIAADDTKQACPEILFTKKRRLISFGEDLKYFIKFPKTSNDDYDILEKNKIRDKAKILEILKQDFDNIYNLGGFYYFSFHSHLMADKEYIGVLDEFIDYVKSKDVWFATFSEASNWWINWSLVDVVASPVSSHRISLKLTNNSNKNVYNIKVDMISPFIRNSINITAEKLGIPIPTYETNEGNITLNIESVKKGENQTFFINFD